MDSCVKTLARQRLRISAQRRAACALLVLFFPALLRAQTSSSDTPVPILSGSAGYFTFVTAGQTQLDAQINPVLLLPLGEHWLAESRAEFEGAFQRSPDGGPYSGPVRKNLDYVPRWTTSPILTLPLPLAGF